jgi:hypothetical protein
MLAQSKGDEDNKSLPNSATGSTAAPGAFSSANDVDSKNSPQSDINTTDGSGNWISRWLNAVDQARASQPHFVSPIVTTHVMLVQQYRYDIGWQPGAVPGTGSTNYGSSRGLEIIPTTRLEVGLFPPAYVTHQSGVGNGFGDFSFQVKYRLFSGTEGKGDYFVGLFFGGSLPTGSSVNGTGHTILSPTLALAKGFGRWDIQSTIGGNLPASGVNILGRSIVFNTAVDYRIKGKIWPMLEQNSTFWAGGALNGKKQTFLTPGLVLGSFPIAKRLRFTVGAGYQIAVTSFRQYNHRWILSFRFPF